MLLSANLYTPFRCVAGHADRRRCVQVPIAVAVLQFGARHVELVAQSQVEGQLAADFPIVLDEEAPVVCTWECLGIDVVVAAVAEAQQERCEAAALQAVAGVEILAGGLLPEGEVALRIAGLGVVQEVVAEFGARLDIVAALGFRHGCRKLVHTLLAVQDDVSLGAHLHHAEAVEHGERLEGGVVVHVLGQAESARIEVLERHALVLGIDKPVIQHPDGGGCLHVSQIAAGRLGVSVVGSIVRAVRRADRRIDLREQVGRHRVGARDAVPAADAELVVECVIDLDIGLLGRADVDTRGVEVIGVSKRIGGRSIGQRESTSTPWRIPGRSGSTE